MKGAVRKAVQLSLVAAGLAVLPGVVYADTIYTFTTGANGNANQSATATFDFSSANTLALTLTNTGTIVDISSVLDDFHFNLSGTPTSSSLTSITSGGDID